MELMEFRLRKSSQFQATLDFNFSTLVAAKNESTKKECETNISLTLGFPRFLWKFWKGKVFVGKRRCEIMHIFASSGKYRKGHEVAFDFWFEEVRQFWKRQSLEKREVLFFVCSFIYKDLLVLLANLRFEFLVWYW